MHNLCKKVTCRLHVFSPGFVYCCGVVLAFSLQRLRSNAECKGGCSPAQGSCHHAKCCLVFSTNLDLSGSCMQYMREAKTCCTGGIFDEIKNKGR